VVTAVTDCGYLNRVLTSVLADTKLGAPVIISNAANTHVVR